MLDGGGAWVVLTLGESPILAHMPGSRPSRIPAPLAAAPQKLMQSPSPACQALAYRGTEAPLNVRVSLLVTVQQQRAGRRRLRQRLGAVVEPRRHLVPVLVADRADRPAALRHLAAEGERDAAVGRGTGRL